MEWWLYFVWFGLITISYLITNYLNKNTKIFTKLPTWLILPLPFLIYLCIGLPLTIQNVDIMIILISTSIPMAIAFGFMLGIFLERYNNWTKKKLQKAKDKKK